MQFGRQEVLPGFGYPVSIDGQAGDKVIYIVVFGACIYRLAGKSETECFTRVKLERNMASGVLRTIFLVAGP